MRRVEVADPVRARYVPPRVAWRLPVFVEASAPDVAAKVVECRTCPIFLMCEAGQGGTGWTCRICRATGVWVDAPDGNQPPEDVIIVDCTKHKFWTREAADQLAPCALCSGGVMELEVLADGTRQHYIATAHAGVPMVERQRQLGQRYEYWKAQHRERRP